MSWSEVRFVDHDGASLAVEEVGDPADPAIVLVCGGGTTKESWDDELCERLAAGGRRVVRFDLRDTGQSTTVPPGEAAYTSTDLFDDLAAVIRSLEAPSVHVWGMSLGGGIVQGLATRHPGLVASIVLQSTSPAVVAPGDGPELPGPTSVVLATFTEPPREPDWTEPASVAAHAVAAERPYAGTIPFDAERVGRAAVRMVERGGPQRSMDNLVMVASGPHVIDLATIDAPTLVIHGDADPMFPLPHGRRLAGMIANAELLVVPGLGHQYPPPETWAVIVPAVLAHTAATGS